MSNYTVVYGSRELVAVYKDGELACTHDKFTKGNGDLDRYLKKLELEGHEIVETKSEFSSFGTISHKLPDSGCVCPPGVSDTGSDTKPDEVNLNTAGIATIKGYGTVTPAEVKRGPGRPPKAKK